MGSLDELPPPFDPLDPDEAVGVLEEGAAVVLDEAPVAAWLAVPEEDEAVAVLVLVLVLGSDGIVGCGTELVVV